MVKPGAAVIGGATAASRAGLNNARSDAFPDANARVACVLIWMPPIRQRDAVRSSPGPQQAAKDNDIPASLLDRHAGFGVLLAVAPTTPGAPAGGPTPIAAVFAFEFDDTSLQGEMRGLDAGDRARLDRLDQQVREALAQSGHYVPVAVSTDPGKPSWWTCDGCEVDPARKAGAEVSVIGWVKRCRT